MKINVYQDVTLLEDRVDVFCSVETGEVREIVKYVKGLDQGRLIGIRDQERHVLLVSELFYFESVDKKCFAYMESEVFQIEANLIELESTLMDQGFVRINKSTIVNLYRIQYIKSELNMRVHAYLENGEILIISRHYKKVFEDCIVRLKNRLLGGLNEIN